MRVKHAIQTHQMALVIIMVDTNTKLNTISPITWCAPHTSILKKAKTKKNNNEKPQQEDRRSVQQTKERKIPIPTPISLFN